MTASERLVFVPDRERVPRLEALLAQARDIAQRNAALTDGFIAAELEALAIRIARELPAQQSEE